MASIEWRGGETCRITVSLPKTVGYGYEKIRKTITLPANLTEKQKKKEVEKAALLFEESIKSGDYLDGERITLGEFIQIWMREYAEKELAPSTLVHYKMRIEKRILPALGHLKLARIQPGHITAFYNNLTEENIRLDGIFTPTAALMDKLTPHSNSNLSKETGLGRNIFHRLKTGGGGISLETVKKLCIHFGGGIEDLFTHQPRKASLASKTIRHHHALLSGIFSLAMEWNLIKDNPVKRVRLPSITKAQSPKAMHYDDEQVTQMLLALEDEPIKYRTVLYIALDTGLRLSELAGLTWPMVNFDENIIHVTSQRQYVPGYGILQLEPKTASGVRIITMSETAANKLKDYRLYQSTMRHSVGSAWQGKEDQIVFTHEDGSPIHPTRPSAWFNGFLKRKELPHITFHGLRHTNASLLISANIDIVTLAGRLGHSDKNVTLNTYSHIIRSREKAMANKMDQFYKKELSSQNFTEVSKEA